MCPSIERPDILVDHFEHKQWTIDNDSEKTTSNSQIPETHSSAGRTRINEDVEVNTDPISVAEIIWSLKKTENNRSRGP